MKEFIKDLGDSLINLIYPKICCACGSYLYNNENVICTACIHQLPRTNYIHEVGNPVEQLFWGRVKIEHAASYFYYHKGSRYQAMIHRFKYYGYKEIGIEMGKYIGNELKKSRFSNIDVVIPVPLHYIKKRRRGFNQSEVMAHSIAQAMCKGIDCLSFIRAVNTRTQTRQSRYDRWLNVENIFKVENPVQIENKHILLVDDIVTSGATLEACAYPLLKLKNVRISIITMAFANY